ncbi:hypothetical protein QN277_002669 [Acacia crassicarpa]|uniref:GRF-type domain-containing protein n=1 Tax=Acacia crassicarpa TaxID=499986 RepID=A0AAE1NA09_9FABA|nr:hypothetical protein QN277_002669 [Acacia crassicarpa]
MGDSTTSSISGSRRRVARLRRGSRELQYEGPSRICHCGIAAPLCTSWTEQNQGRRFFGCRNYQQGNGCGFFQWHDGQMGERSTEVINELLGHVDRLYDNNVMQGRGDDNQADRIVDEKLSDMHLVMEKLDSKLRKIDGRLGLTICGLVLTWMLIVVYILC